MNPCREISTAGLAPGSEPRRQLIETEVYDRFYNTNYTASWFLVRTAPVLDESGNLRPANPACGVDIRSRNCTSGPLSSTAWTRHGAGQHHPAAGRRSAGRQSAAADRACMRPAMWWWPVHRRSRTAIHAAAGSCFARAPRAKVPHGWWAVWTREVLQDYRQFAAVHRGTCNILFADGGVRNVKDSNDDGCLTTVFPPWRAAVSRATTVELTPKEIMSLYSLNAIRMAN